jgi:hypothetical protein
LVQAPSWNALVPVGSYREANDGLDYLDRQVKYQNEDDEAMDSASGALFDCEDTRDQ